MAKFMYVFRGVQSSKDRSSEELQKVMERWSQWASTFRTRDAMLGGAPLANDGAVVHSDGLVTDGPFAEGKEVVGGFFMVECADLAEATELAKQCPGLSEPGMTVEVRPCRT